MQTGLDKEATKVEAQTKGSPTVKVFYDPDEPSRSMLKKGVSEDTSYQWKRLKTEQAAPSNR